MWQLVALYEHVSRLRSYAFFCFSHGSFSRQAAELRSINGAPVGPGRRRGKTTATPYAHPAHAALHLGGDAPVDINRGPRDVVGGGEARKRAAALISSGSPKRPTGILAQRRA